MGAFIASVEAGDASANIIPQWKRCSISDEQQSKNFLYTISENDSFISSLNHNKNDYNGALLVENSLFNEISDAVIHDNCQFPYYRSSKCSDQYLDAVLVKDVGVSCMLLNQNEHDMYISEAKNYLHKQLRKEYTDLANITNKITTYTKDILNHLSKKHQKKQHLQNSVSSTHAIASQYLDNKGNLCLKLRLLNNTKVQCCDRQIFSESYNTNKNDTEEPYNKNLKEQIVCQNERSYQEDKNKKEEKETQTTFFNEGVQTSMSSLNTNKNIKKCDSVTLTDWKEISKSRRPKKLKEKTQFLTTRE